VSAHFLSLCAAMQHKRGVGVDSLQQRKREGDSRRLCRARNRSRALRRNYSSSGIGMAAASHRSSSGSSSGGAIAGSSRDLEGLGRRWCAGWRQRPRAWSRVCALRLPARARHPAATEHWWPPQAPTPTPCFVFEFFNVCVCVYVKETSKSCV